MAVEWFYTTSKQQMGPISWKELLELAQALRELCGINLPLSEKNLSLIAARLAPVFKSYEF